MDSKQLKNWEKAINKMSKEELQYALAFPDCYYPEYLELVKARLDELSSIPDYDAMSAIVKNVIEEMGCPYEITEDGDFDFYFKGGHFLLIMNHNGHYIDIWEYFWKMANLDDADEVDRLKRSINKANAKCSITTVYEIDNEKRAMYVHSTTSILYRPMIFNLKDYLYLRLSNFFFAHDLINAEVTLLAERECPEQIASVRAKTEKQPS